MTRQNIAVVVGTRPEVIKMAPIVFALRDSELYQPVLISTGQQREMLDQAFEVFGLKPDIELGLMAPKQTLADLTARALVATSSALADVAPAWTLVQGDTTTAFAAGLASFYAQIPVGHVEAGLRSGRRYSPFPEELNRRMLDQLSELLFAPTMNAASQLADEGFPASRIHTTGNTVVDALLEIRKGLKCAPVSIPGLDESKLVGKRLVLVTAHRRESFGAPLMEMCQALVQIVRDNPEVVLVYPVHLNPNVQDPVRRILDNEDRIILLPPLGYRELVSLMERSYIVLTDSGGIQEEAPTFGKPLLVMRDVTERPEGIEAGVARLVGTSAQVIRHEANRLLQDAAAHRAMSGAVNPYGDGTAARMIVRLLERSAGARKAA